MNWTELTAWEQFLRWTTSPSGIPLIVGVLLSVILEYVPRFGNLAPKWKRVVFFGASLTVPVLGSWLGIATCGWPGTWTATWWPSIVAGAMAFASGTLTHLVKLPDLPSERNRVRYYLRRRS